MKSQFDSVIFEEINGKALIDLVTKHRNDIPSWVLSTDDLYENIRHIEKRVSDPYKFKVLDAIKNKSVRFVFNVEHLSKIPRYTIYWNMIEDGKVITYINLTFIAKRLKNTNEFNCPTHTFYVLAVFGALVNKLSVGKFIAVTNNIKVLHSLASIYSTMMVMPLRQRFGVSSDTMLSEQYQYAAAKFFLNVICEKQNSPTIDAVANNAGALSLLPDGVINNVNYHFEFDKISSLPEFIEKLKTFNRRTSDASIRYLIQDYTSLYKSYSLLSIENVPYLLLMIIDVVLLGDITNIFRLERILGKNAVPAYNSIMSLL